MPENKSERTEKPSPKRREKARSEGRVARSAEIGSWFSLLVLVLVLPALGGRAESAVSGFMDIASNAMAKNDPTGSVGLLGRGLWTVLQAAGPLVVVATLGAMVAGIGQVGIRFSPGALRLNWKKVSPLSGIQRIVSPKGIWEFAKLVARLLLIVTIGYIITHHLVDILLSPSTPPIEATISVASHGLLNLVRAEAGAGLVLAFGDYAFQRRQFNQSMKMTKEELRREHRETEGNPEMRRVLRRKRRRLSRMQILAAVSKAEVIVVNPTHFAVGLAYDRKKDKAPRVVTKGEDDDALAIRELASDHGVTIVENPPVARSLYQACEIGDEVPPFLYEVAARLLAFVYRLSPTARALVDIHKMAG